MRCWTCETKYEVTLGDQYVCESCDHIADRIHSLERTEWNTISSIDHLIQVQEKGFASLAGEMQGISSAIEWGFEELGWRLQQQTDVLKEIAKLLKTPTETKANEWREMGEELRRRGVYEKAIEFLSKSLKANPIDFRTYIGLGETCLRMRKFDYAKKYFEESLPHAPTDFYKSYTLRLIGRIHYCREDYDLAVRMLSEAVSLTPNYVEACYDLAQYHAVKENVENAVSLLREVVRKNDFYFYLIEKERNFDPIRKDVLGLQKELKKDAYEDAQNGIERTQDALENTDRFWEQFIALKKDRKIRLNFERAVNSAASDDYRSILWAKSMAKYVLDITLAAKNKIPFAEKIQEETNQACQKEMRQLDNHVILHALTLSGFIVGILCALGTRNLWFLTLLPVAWFLEFIIEMAEEGQVWGFWFGPFFGVVRLFRCLISKQKMQEKYSNILKERMSSVIQEIYDFWKD